MHLVQRKTLAGSKTAPHSSQWRMLVNLYRKVTGHTSMEPGSFAVQLDETKTVTQVLGCLVESKKEEPGHCVVDSASVVIHVVSRAKSSQMTLKLPSSTFVHYHYEDEDAVSFSVDLGHVVDCLQLLGTTTSDDRTATLSYTPSDAVLKLTLEEQGIFTTCDVAVLDLDPDVQSVLDVKAAFRATATVCKFIAPSPLFRDLFCDFDDNAALRVTVTPAKLIIANATGVGTKEVHAPRGLFHKFDVGNRHHSFTYRNSAFLRGMRALAYATDTYIQINADGMLHVQHILGLPRSSGALDADDLFLEYTCCSADVDDSLDDRDPDGGLDRRRSKSSSSSQKKKRSRSKKSKTHRSDPSSFASPEY